MEINGLGTSEMTCVTTWWQTGYLCDNKIKRRAIENMYSTLWGYWIDTGSSYISYVSSKLLKLWICLVLCSSFASGFFLTGSIDRQVARSGFCGSWYEGRPRSLGVWDHMRVRREFHPTGSERISNVRRMVNGRPTRPQTACPRLRTTLVPRQTKTSR